MDIKGVKMKTGYYQSKKDETEIVKAIYFKSFEEEVIIEDFNGVYRYFTVSKLLRHYRETNKAFKPKMERIKDSVGSPYHQSVK